MPRTETEMAVGADRPRGRDWLAACRLALSGQDLVTDLTPWKENLGINPFTKERSTVILILGFCLQSLRMNLENTQGKRARERFLFRNKVRGKSSWLTPGGDKRAWGSALSRGFIGS